MTCEHSSQCNTRATRYATGAPFTLLSTNSRHFHISFLAPVKKIRIGMSVYCAVSKEEITLLYSKPELLTILYPSYFLQSSTAKFGYYELKFIRTMLVDDEETNKCIYFFRYCLLSILFHSEKPLLRSRQ